MVNIQVLQTAVTKNGEIVNGIYQEINGHGYIYDPQTGRNYAGVRLEGQDG